MYPWAINQNKLQRAIDQVRREQQPENKKEARIKDLYVSYGGKLNTSLPFPEKKEESEVVKKEIPPIDESTVSSTPSLELGSVSTTEDTPL